MSKPAKLGKSYRMSNPSLDGDQGGDKNFQTAEELRNFGLMSILTQKFDQLNNVSSILGLPSANRLTEDQIKAINRIKGPLNIRNSTRVKRESILFVEFSNVLSNLGDKKLEGMLSSIPEEDKKQRIPQLKKLEKEYKKKTENKKNKNKINREIFLLRKHGGLLPQKSIFLFLSFR